MSGGSHPEVNRIGIAVCWLRPKPLAAVTMTAIAGETIRLRALYGRGNRLPCLPAGNSGTCRHSARLWPARPEAACADHTLRSSQPGSRLHQSPRSRPARARSGQHALIPSLILFAPDGTEVLHHTGLFDEPHLRRQIEAQFNQEGAS